MAESVEIELEDEHACGRLGTALSEALAAGDVVLLEGALGAGKTTLVRYIARGLGVPESVAVTSPTFVLVHELPGRVPIVHVDLYRLADADELVELGLEEHLGQGALVLVEWGERFADALGRPTLMVRLSLGEGTVRHARIEACSERGAALVSRLAAHGAL